MADTRFPRTGYGDMIGEYFKDSITISQPRVDISDAASASDDTVVIYNHAVSGATTASFMETTSSKPVSWWDQLLANVVPGDYVFIGFCHNDSNKITKDEYRANLLTMISDVKSRFATPVICLPIVRRYFEGAGGTFTGDNFNGYDAIAKEVADSQNLTVIDLTTATKNYIFSLGETTQERLAESLKMYMEDPQTTWNTNYAPYAPAGGTDYESHLRDVENSNGEYDNTHVTRYGADIIASFIAKQLSESNLKLAEYLDESALSKTFDNASFSYSSYYGN